MGLEIVEKPGPNKLDVVELSGSVDMGTVDILADGLKAIFESGARKIVLDMKGLESFSSAGWGCLVEWKFKFHQAGGDVALACMHDAQLRVYELMGLDATFKQFPDVQQAVISVGGTDK
jgi:anti-anti-sigma factor